MRGYRQFPTRTTVEFYVTPAQADAGQNDAYGALLWLWNMASIAEGVKSFVIHQLRLSGLWGLSGHKKWEEFCPDVLHVSKRTANRMAMEGAVARTIIDVKYSLAKMSKADDIGQVASYMEAQYSKPQNDKTGHGVPFEGFSDKNESKTSTNPRRIEAASDRNVLRTIARQPTETWKTIIDRSVEIAGTSPMTVAAVKTAIAEQPVPVPKKPTPSKKQKARPSLSLDEYNDIRYDLRGIGDTLVYYANGTPAELNAAIDDLANHAEQLTKIVRKLRKGR